MLACFFHERPDLKGLIKFRAFFEAFDLVMTQVSQVDVLDSFQMAADSVVLPIGFREFARFSEQIRLLALFADLSFELLADLAQVLKVCRHRVDVIVAGLLYLESVQSDAKSQNTTFERLQLRGSFTESRLEVHTKFDHADLLGVGKQKYKA